MTTTKPYNVDLNITQLREDAHQRLRQALKDLDAIDAFLMLGSRPQIFTEPEVHANGNGQNGTRKAARRIGLSNAREDIKKSILQIVDSASSELRARDLHAALSPKLQQAHQSSFYGALKALVVSGDLQHEGQLYSRGGGESTPTNGTPSSPLSPSQSVIDVLAAAYPRGMTNREVSEALVMKGVEFKNSRHSHLVQTGWHLNTARDGGRIRVKGAGPTRLCFAIPPKVKVSKGE